VALHRSLDVWGVWLRSARLRALLGLLLCPQCRMLTQLCARRTGWVPGMRGEPSMRSG